MASNTFSMTYCNLNLCALNSLFRLGCSWTGVVDDDFVYIGSFIFRCCSYVFFIFTKWMNGPLQFMRKKTCCLHILLVPLSVHYQWLQFSMHYLQRKNSMLFHVWNLVLCMVVGVKCVWHAWQYFCHFDSLTVHLASLFRDMEGICC